MIFNYTVINIKSKNYIYLKLNEDYMMNTKNCYGYLFLDHFLDNRELKRTLNYYHDNNSMLYLNMISLYPESFNLGCKKGHFMAENGAISPSLDFYKNYIIFEDQLNTKDTKEFKCCQFKLSDIFSYIKIKHNLKNI